jgi:hypothetical protein
MEEAYDGAKLLVSHPGSKKRETERCQVLQIRSRLHPNDLKTSY